MKSNCTISFYRDFMTECEKIFHQKKVHVVIAGQTLLTCLVVWGLKISNLGRLRNASSSMGYDLSEYLDGFFFARTLLALSLGIIGPIFICTLSGDLVAGEVQEGTIKLYAVRARSRVQILMSKWFALASCTLLFTVGAGLFALVIGCIFFGWPGTQLVPLIGTGYGNDINIFSLNQALLRYMALMIYSGFTLMTLGSLTLFLSCLFNRMTSATITGITLYFISYLIEHMPYLSAFKPYVLSRVMNGSIYLWFKPIPTHQIIDNLLVNLMYIVFFTGAALITFHHKDIA